MGSRRAWVSHVACGAAVASALSSGFTRGQRWDPSRAQPSHPHQPPAPIASHWRRVRVLAQSVLPVHPPLPRGPSPTPVPLGLKSIWAGVHCWETESHSWEAVCSSCLEVSQPGFQPSLPRIPSSSTGNPEDLPTTLHPPPHTHTGCPTSGLCHTMAPTHILGIPTLGLWPYTPWVSPTSRLCPHTLGVPPQGFTQAMAPAWNTCCSHGPLSATFSSLTSAAAAPCLPAILTSFPISFPFTTRSPCLGAPCGKLSGTNRTTSSHETSNRHYPLQLVANPASPASPQHQDRGWHRPGVQCLLALPSSLHPSFHPADG